MHSAYSGLSHGLSALWTPAPHVLVQWDQDDQTPHPPWIASGVLPTVMHSPEKHHWREKRKDKQLKITIAGKCYCELFVISVPECQKLKWKCKWRHHRIPLFHAEQWQSYLWFLCCPFAGSAASRQHGSQSPCFLHIEFHLQLHPVWSGRSLSLSTRVFGKGSGKERKLQQSEAELNFYS